MTTRNIYKGKCMLSNMKRGFILALVVASIFLISGIGGCAPATNESATGEGTGTSGEQAKTVASFTKTYQDLTEYPRQQEIGEYIVTMHATRLEGDKCVMGFDVGTGTENYERLMIRDISTDDLGKLDSVENAKYGTLYYKLISLDCQKHEAKMYFELKQ